MSYVATVLARNTDGWTAQEVSLDDVEDIDAVAEVIVAVDDTAEDALLFLEEEDEYLAIVRVTGDGEDPRVFLSDAHAVDSFALASLLMDGVDIDAPSEDEDTPAGHDSEPAGDTSVVADLGTPAAALVRLCNAEGALPSDIVVAVAERAGALEELELLRAT